MEFRDLGPLQVDEDGITLPLSGRRLESVLAVLVANVGEVVTVDALVDAVWGQAAFERAPQSLESLVWRLRKVLEPGRVARQAASVLQTEGRGYRLAVPVQAVDSHCLAQAAQTVPELLRSGEVTRALDAADTALARWRGQPYLGVPDAAWMAPVRGQLEEAHLALQQYRVQALLHADQPERALRELAPLLAAHPHREQLWGQRMLALYRSGRQSEALQTFADARAALADELGVDPGPELRDLHHQILAHDRRLDLPGPTPDANQPVLATSREPLDLADEQVLAVPPLPTPRSHDDLASNPAARLFLQRIGTPPHTVDEHARAAVARICTAVDGLPLGLELAAARARTFELAEVAASLEADPIGLTHPGRGPTRRRTLYDTVDWSYRLARAHEQVLHRRLSAVNGPITLDAAQALCDLPPLRPAQAMDLLARSSTGPC